MALRILRFATLLLASLSLTMESAHLLEFPQKIQYSAEFYAAVNTTLYRYFALVGGAWQMGAMGLALILAFEVRRNRRSFRWAVPGAALLVAAFAVWLVVVAPVNRTIEDAIALSTASAPALWMQLRERWEYGHVAGFVLQVLGLSCLLWSVLVDTEPVPR